MIAIPSSPTVVRKNSIPRRLEAHLSRDSPKKPRVIGSSFDAHRNGQSCSGRIAQSVSLPLDSPCGERSPTPATHRPPAVGDQATDSCKGPGRISRRRPPVQETGRSRDHRATGDGHSLASIDLAADRANKIASKNRTADDRCRPSEFNSPVLG